MAEKQVLFVLLLSTVVGVSIAGKIAYVVSELSPPFKCVALPKNDYCSGDFMVLGDNGTFNGSTFVSLKTIQGDLQQKLINQSCYDAFKDLTCLTIQRCTPEKLSVDVAAAMAACEKGKAACSGTSLNSSFNCTKAMYQSLNRDMKPIECKVVGDRNGTCPDSDYRLPQYPGRSYQNGFKNLAKLLRGLRPNLTRECYDEVHKTGCEIAGNQPCSDDNKYALAFITRQDCAKSLQCVKEQTENDLGAWMCVCLPDGNIAKKVYFSDNGSATFNQAMSAMFLSLFITVSFLFL